MTASGASDAAQADGEGAPAVCANCGYERTNRFCPRCGQNDRDYIRSLPPVLGDILKETFELDSRLLRTIKPMFLRPGELPSEFSRNRRARYVSAIRLYIFASLAFFFLLSLTTDFRPPVPEGGGNGEEPGVQAAREGADVEALKAVLPPYQQRKVDRIVAQPGLFLSKSIIYPLSVGLAENDEPLADWERFMLARLVDALEDPRAAFSLLLDNLPFSMFITLPAYAVLLMLFFVGSRRYFTEHLVFAVQLHTFAFIVFTVLVLLPDDDERRPRPERVAALSVDGPSTPAAGAATSTAATIRERLRRARAADDDDEDGAEPTTVALGPAHLVDWLELLLALWVPAYHYLALRRYYGNGRMKTAIKWAMLSGAYTILLIPGFLLSLALTFIQL